MTTVSVTQPVPSIARPQRSVRWAPWALAVIFPFLWGAMVYFGWPSAEVVMAFGHPFVQTVLVFAAAWAVRGEKPLWLVTWICLWLLLGGMLAERWAINDWDIVLISGQFFIADPSGYILEASKIVHGSRMEDIGTFRPLAHAFLASHLYLFVGNLKLIHLIYVFWQSLAFMWALRVIARRVHFGAGAIVLAVMLAFLWRFTGVFMTEPMGLMLGAVALALLVEAAVQRDNLGLHMWGLAILTLALLTRAGAFFVLPAILGWSCMIAGSDWKRFIHVGAMGVVVVLACFALNLGLATFVANPSEGMGNFSFTLYGLAVGKDWTAGAETGLPSKELYAESFRLIAAEPMLIVRAFTRCLRAYFGDLIDYGGGPVKGWMFDSELIGRVLQLGALVSIIAAIVLRRRQPILLLFVFFLIGFMASLPFAPPWDAGGRTYAATVPLSALMAAAGLTLPLQIRRRKREAQDSAASIPGVLRWPVAYLGAFLAMAVALPIGLVTVLPNPERLPFRNPDGSMPVVLQPGNYAVLHEQLDAHPYPPNWQLNSWMLDTDVFDYYWSKAHDIMELIPGDVVLAQQNGIGFFVLPLSALDHVRQRVDYHGYATELDGLYFFVEQSFPELIAQIEQYLASIPSDSPIPYLRNFDFTHFPWVSHPRLGFMWADEKESYSDGVFLFSRDPDYGHLFTSPMLYPKFIRHDDKHELEFVPATGKMFNRTTGEEMELPQDPPTEGQQ